jgi:phosphatidate cytidylyltransferase
MSSATQLRILTAVILMPAVAAAIWWSPTWLLAGLAAIVSIIALREFFALGERLGFRAYRFWTCLAALGIFAQQCYATLATSIGRLGDLLHLPGTPRVSLEMVLVLFVMGAALIALGSRRALTKVFSSVAVSASGLVVIVIPFSAVVRLHGVAAAGAGSTYALNAYSAAWSPPGLGRQLLLFTLVIVWVGDSAAYFAGHAFGRSKMTPHLSPNKTWEGAGANLLGALLVASLFAYWMKFPAKHMLAMAALGSIAGQVGDLFESAFKRSAGVKDSGTLIPGHGGMLDRIDALIFAAPAVWYYFEWFVMRRI